MKRKHVQPEMFKPWNGLFETKKYRVEYLGQFQLAKTASVVGGNLQYELYDGTRGVAKLGEWHEDGKPVTKLAPQDVKYPTSESDCLKFTSGTIHQVVHIEDDDNILEI